MISYQTETRIRGEISAALRGVAAQITADREDRRPVVERIINEARRIESEYAARCFNVFTVKMQNPFAYANEMQHREELEYVRDILREFI